MLKEVNEANGNEVASKSDVNEDSDASLVSSDIEEKILVELVVLALMTYRNEAYPKCNDQGIVLFTQFPSHIRWNAYWRSIEIWLTGSPRYGKRWDVDGQSGPPGRQQSWNLAIIYLTNFAYATYSFPGFK